MSMCWVCGKTEKNVYGGGDRPMTVVQVDGKNVNVHESCAKNEGLVKDEPKRGRLPQNQRWKGNP